MIVANAVELVADWWFAIVLFVVLPLGVFVKLMESVENWRGRARSTSSEEVDRMTRTREEGDRSAYTQTKREARRHG